MSLTLARLNGSNFSYQLLPLTRCLDDMADLGLTSLELWGIAPHLHIPAVTSEGVATLRRELKARELRLHTLTPEQCVYPVNIASAEDWLRESSIAMFVRAAEVASELEAPYLLVTSGRGYADEPWELAWDRAVASLRVIAGVAEPLGVTLLLEALQPSESNLVLSASDIGAMREAVDAPNLGVVLDTVAMSVAGDDVAAYVEATGGLGVQHVHLVDGRPTGHLAVGDGELPLDALVNDLEAAGYTGQVTFELFDASYLADPRAALERAIAAALALG